MIKKPLAAIGLFYESIVFAIQALRSNLLRTTLSLLGVTVGIFSIIAVYTVVDSLEKSIKDSMSFLGSNVVYVQRFPWNFDKPDYPWWKYMRRPVPTVNDFRTLERGLTTGKGVSIFAIRGGITVKHKSNSLSGVAVQGVTYGFNNVSDVNIAIGRYFTPQEIETGQPVAIIGSELAEALFKGEEAFGNSFKYRGTNFKVIGIMQKQGKNLLGTPTSDNNFLVPFDAFRKLFLVGNRGIEPFIGIKGDDDDPNLENLQAEITGLLRRSRGLRPTEEDNFALNRPEMIAKVISGVFDIITFAGGIIGSFSLLVGGFGIANIMFVSVKERTNLIGIQKAIGAKNSFILSQFLFEAVFLSLVGGGIGLLLVYLITILPQDFMSIGLSYGNVMIGVSISVAIGILSGIVPAITASKLDPVEAIRSK